MALTDHTIGDHVIELSKRVASLEVVVYEDTSEDHNAPRLTIKNIKHSISYANSIGINKYDNAQVTVTWDKATDGDDDDIEKDPVVDYNFGYSIIGSNDFIYTRTANKTRAVITVPVLSTVLLRITAVTKKGTEGVPATHSVVVSSGVPAPNQPATPILEPGLARVSVRVLNQDSTGAAWPDYIKHLEVHYKRGTDVTFTPNAGTLYDIVPVGSSTSIPADGNYTPIVVRTVAVNVANIKSPPSTGVRATPNKAVNSDFGVPILNEVPYSDQDNLLPDGGFESDYYTNKILANNPGAAFTLVTPAFVYQGKRCIKFEKPAGNTATKFYFHLTKKNDTVIDSIKPLDQDSHILVATIRGMSLNDGTKVHIMAQTSYSDGKKRWFTVTKAAADIHNWLTVSAVIPAPVDATITEIEPYFRVDDNTQGSVYFDAVMLRRVIGSQYIANASIGSAHIIDAAVTNAKIESLEAGKITAGSIQADQYIDAGQPTGKKSRLSPDGLTIYSVDDSGTQFITSRLGSPSADEDSLSITNQLGDSVFNVSAITQETFAKTFNTSPSGETRIYGKEFFEHFDPYTRLEAWGDVSQKTTNVSQNMDWRDYAMLEFELDKKYNYRLDVTNIQAFVNPGVNTAFMQFMTMAKLASATEWTRVDLISEHFSQAYSSVSNIHNMSLFGFTPNTPDGKEKCQVKLRYKIIASNTSPTVTGYVRSCSMYVHKVQKLQGSAKFIGTADGTVNPNPTVENYTSRWVCNSTATYKGNGQQRTDTHNIRQGVIGGQQGDQYGMALFTDGAVSGEKGKRIWEALSSGNVTIHSARVYLYPNFSYYFRGGTGLVSVHNHTSLTNAAPNSPKKQVSGLKRGSGKWIDITDMFTTSSRGVWVGKTGTSDKDFYIWFDGANNSNPPMLEIEYTRRT